MVSEAYAICETHFSPNIRSVEMRNEIQYSKHGTQAPVDLVENLLLLVFVDAVEKLCILLRQTSFHVVVQVVRRCRPSRLFEGNFLHDKSLLFRRGVVHCIFCHLRDDRECRSRKGIRGAENAQDISSESYILPRILSTTGPQLHRGTNCVLDMSTRQALTNASLRITVTDVHHLPCVARRITTSNEKIISSLGTGSQDWGKAGISHCCALARAGRTTISGESLSLPL
jgi:hypothetical protein